jgi:hypothetical protein
MQTPTENNAPVTIYCFGPIRQDYAELSKLLPKKKFRIEDDDELNITNITLRAFDGRSVLYPSDPTSEHDTGMVVGEDAEQYWKTSQTLRSTLTCEKELENISNPVASSNNCAKLLHFFRKNPGKTAAILLGTFEATSTGIAYGIDKDLLTSMSSNSMLAVYLSPVAAVIILFSVAATYAYLKKDQDAGSSHTPSIPTLD